MCCSVQDLQDIIAIPGIDEARRRQADRLARKIRNFLSQPFLPASSSPVSRAST
jgi:F0F1-type ATP synthase beta subunit